MVILIAQQTGHLFYERLFEVSPELRSLFNEDTSLQEKKLIDTITYVVANLDKLDNLATDVKELGQRHKEYGAQTHHYPIVGDSLIWALQKGLKDNWNKELEDAWRLAYTTLSDAMTKS